MQRRDLQPGGVEDTDRGVIPGRSIAKPMRTPSPGEEVEWWNRLPPWTTLAQRPRHTSWHVCSLVDRGRATPQTLCCHRGRRADRAIGHCRHSVRQCRCPCKTVESRSRAPADRPARERTLRACSALRNYPSRRDSARFTAVVAVHLLRVLAVKVAQQRLEQLQD